MILALALLLPQEEKELHDAIKAFAAWHDEAWDRALALDATLVVKLIGAVNDADGRSVVVSATVSHSGRDAAKAALAELYRDMDPKVEIEGALIRGSDAMLRGELSVSGPDGRRAHPLHAQLKFDEARKIRHMTLTVVQARPGPAPAR